MRPWRRKGRRKGSERALRRRFREICLVSHGELQAGPAEASVQVAPARGKKCVRCWKHEETVGRDATHTELCGRCLEVVKGKRA
ncbi:MAG: hypothetical protein EBT68_01970 [Verrucomicrobia bacterium]|nr:hypothetical protein [Verrucomicrobiota bacterium]